jgi:hypothetical protein
LGHENIGIAYANRSVIFMKQEFYKLAIENIQLARQNGYPQSKLEKLAEREERCLEKIRSGKSKEDSFQKNKNAKEKLLGERLPANKKFPFYLTDCLYLDKSDTFGNHIRTKQDLKSGTIIATERPFAASLDQELTFRRCEYCKSRNEMNLIPCNTCTRALYCSEKCRQEAFDKYHKYICGINRVFPCESYNILKLFCLGLNCFENPTEFFEFLRETEDSEVTGWDLDFKGMDQNEINKNLFLVLNSPRETKQFLSSPKKDLVEIYKIIAFTTVIVLNYSKLKDIMITEDHKIAFRKFVFRHMEMVPQYYFGWQSFLRCEPYAEEVCRGILSLTNFFNNSCAPNVRVFFDNSKVRFVTMRPIKKGEQLFVGYGKTHVQQSVEDRQASLFKERGYVCKCEACEQPHKYPLMDSLQVKDRGAFCHCPKFQREFNKQVQERDVDTAVKQFRLACDYLDAKSHRTHPSYEIHQADMLLQLCIMVFCAYDELKSFK